MIRSESWPDATPTSGKMVSFPVVQDITTRIALSIVLSVAFGLPLSWNDTAKAGMEGGKFSISDAVKLQSDNVIVVAEAPWLLDAPIKK